VHTLRTTVLETFLACTGALGTCFCLTLKSTRGGDQCSQLAGTCVYSCCHKLLAPSTRPPPPSPLLQLPTPITHHPLTTTHHTSPPTTYHLPPSTTTHYTQPTTHHPPPTSSHPPLTTHHSPSLPIIITHHHLHYQPTTPPVKPTVATCLPPECR
jgi:hypothetical protein